MSRLTFTLLFLFVLLLPACGPDPVPEVEIPPWAKVVPEQIAEAKKHGVPVAFENDLGMRFVLIPAGTFLMGSPEDEEGRTNHGLDYDVETQHEVTISRPFYLQIAEVTLGQFREQQGDHTVNRKGMWKPTEPGFDQARLGWPVVYVSQHDATRFAGWLGEQDRRTTYRLPTEAEWEYACRAGGTRAYGYEATLSASKAWIGHKEEGVWMTEVAQFPSNRWGLYDMHGNALEWCGDVLTNLNPVAVVDPLVTSGSGAGVVRGGAYNQSPAAARCASRQGWPQEDAHSGQVGFRLVSPLPEAEE